MERDQQQRTVIVKNNKTTTTTATATTRKPRNAKPASADPLAAIVAVARTINPANIIDVVSRHNANHGITARNVGRYTGMRVMAFQNATMVRNAEWQLDDCQLLAVWVMEFPAAIGRVFAVNGRMGTPDGRAIIDGISIVRGVRSDYNRTGHGDPNGKPAVESVAYGAKRFDVATPATVPAAAEPKPAATRKPAKPAAARKTA